MKCYYGNAKATANSYNKPYLSFFFSFSLLGLLHSFLCLSFFFITLLTSLHTLLAIFNMPCVNNVVRTVRFPFIVAHEMYEMFTKLEWLVNGVFILLTVRTHNVRNIHEA